AHQSATTGTHNKSRDNCIAKLREDRQGTKSWQVRFALVHLDQIAIRAAPHETAEKRRICSCNGKENAVNVACSTLCFARFPLDRALRMIGELEFSKVDVAIHEDGPHLKPSEV